MLEKEIEAVGDLAITQMYPDYDRPWKVTIDICSVRATREIIIHYDFERDGWCIMGPSTFDSDEIIERSFIPTPE
jgi:hypothetical protein